MRDDRACEETDARVEPAAVRPLLPTQLLQYRERALDRPFGIGLIGLGQTEARGQVPGTAAKHEPAMARDRLSCGASQELGDGRDVFRPGGAAGAGDTASMALSTVT